MLLQTILLIVMLGIYLYILAALDSNRSNPYKRNLRHRYRYYYYIHEGMKLINFISSPNHYGRSLISAHETERKLIAKIGPLSKKLDLKNTEVEVGNSSFDKYVLRVKIQANMLGKITKEIVESAGFSPIPQDFYAY